MLPFTTTRICFYPTEKFCLSSLLTTLKCQLVAFLLWIANSLFPPGQLCGISNGYDNWLLKMKDLFWHNKLFYWVTVTSPVFYLYFLNLPLRLLRDRLFFSWFLSHFSKHFLRVLLALFLLHLRIHYLLTPDTLLGLTVLILFMALQFLSASLSSSVCWIRPPPLLPQKGWTFKYFSNF